jgi:hypothetical protein
MVQGLFLNAPSESASMSCANDVANALGKAATGTYNARGWNTSVTDPTARHRQRL